MMTNLIDKIEQAQLREHPDFRVGDRIRVNIQISEGSKKRIQGFEGVCIGRNCQSSNLNASFRVRKESFGVGVERVFCLNAKNIDSIVVVRTGVIRQAKPYYLRTRSQKGQRIKERFTKAAKS